jgi:hypothetical protein
LDTVQEQIQEKSEVIRLQIEAFQTALEATLDAKFLALEGRLGRKGSASNLTTRGHTT